MIVSLNMGATVMFPLLIDGKSFMLWFMALAIVIITSVREFAKDVEDIKVDRGKKRTFALVIDSRIEKRSAIRLRFFLNLLLVALMF